MCKPILPGLLLLLAAAPLFAAPAPPWPELAQQAATTWQSAQPFECDYTLKALQAGIGVTMHGNLLAVPDGHDGKFSMHGNVTAADQSEYPMQFLYADALFYVLELRNEGPQGRQSLAEPVLFLPPAGPALFRLLDPAWNFQPQPDHKHDQAWLCYRGTTKEGVTIAIPFKQLDLCFDSESRYLRRVEWSEGPEHTHITVEFGPATPAPEFDAARLSFQPPPGASIQWLTAPPPAAEPTTPAAEASPAAKEEHAEPPASKQP